MESQFLELLKKDITEFFKHTENDSKSKMQEKAIELSKDYGIDKDFAFGLLVGFKQFNDKK